MVKFKKNIAEIVFEKHKASDQSIDSIRKRNISEGGVGGSYNATVTPGADKEGLAECIRISWVGAKGEVKVSTKRGSSESSISGKLIGTQYSFCSPSRPCSEYVEGYTEVALLDGYDGGGHWMGLPHDTPLKYSIKEEYHNTAEGYHAIVEVEYGLTKFMGCCDCEVPNFSEKEVEIVLNYTGPHKTVMEETPGLEAKGEGYARGEIEKALPHQP